MKTDVFHLQIVPINDILAHEKFDDSRAIPLVARLKKDGFLANPIIVAEIEGNKYLQLDGMNRFSAFKMLGLHSILTQIIDYNDQEEVELSSWVHLFSFVKEDLLKRISQIKDLVVKPGRMEHVGHRYIKVEGLGRLCTVVAQDGSVYLVSSRGTLGDKIDQLNSLVSLYDQKIKRDVLPQHPREGDVKMLFAEYPAGGIMVVFPTFTRHQIVEIVRQNKLFPPGITRHIIKRRCLALNIPLGFFDGKTVEEQNKLFEEMLAKRRFRLYEEPTVYFE